MSKPFYHKFLVFIFVCITNTSTLYAQNSNSDRYPIIPKPAALNPLKGSFTLNDKTQILLTTPDPALKTATNFLVDLVKNANGIALKYGATQKKNKIIFTLDQSITNDEGYKLTIIPQNIQVTSRTPKGAFLAIQTMRQLMPAEIENSQSNLKSVTLPAVQIEDAPRFSYRGIMLDVGRYYFPIDFLKKYIDLLAFYKINNFHLHLTEDAGWRMEIKKYPKLQEIAAWRDSTVVGHVRDKTRKYDGKRHGGFYTQQELKDLVKYAQNRFITIIPEIEMPGHSLAALAAYPELGCKPDTTYKVLTAWGIQKDIFCPNEFTFKFLEDVLTEVMAVFPSKYIHIGGDEAPKERWQQSAVAQDLIKKHNLKDEHGLQSYFIQRIEKFVNAKGRAIIGWDEILEGGLAPNATVMSWRGEEGGIDILVQVHGQVTSAWGEHEVGATVRAHGIGTRSGVQRVQAIIEAQAGTVCRQLVRVGRIAVVDELACHPTQRNLEGTAVRVGRGEGSYFGVAAGDTVSFERCVHGRAGRLDGERIEDVCMRVGASEHRESGGCRCDDLLRKHCFHLDLLGLV